jgi:hypothetical protein
VADAFAPARVLAALEASWSEESSSQWSRGNPACGQCNVTALVLHERYGGEILKTRVSEGEGWHFYNRIGGKIYDFTASQFAAPVRYDDVAASQGDALAGTSVVQVTALARRFDAALR